MLNEASTDEAQAEHEVEASKQHTLVEVTPMEPSHKPYGCPSSPVAVFEQIRGGHSSGNFKFSGWYRIVLTDFLEPRTQELATMLEQKWQVKGRNGELKHRVRDPKDWETSLGHRWAVVKLARDEETDKDRGPLVIECSSPQDPEAGSTPRKSVNAMLAQLRLKEVAAGAEVSK